MQAIHETLKDITQTGIQFTFCTPTVDYESPHWHDEMEILFYLNGSPTITVDRSVHALCSGQVIVINSGQVHNTCCYDTPMFLCTHIHPSQMQNYIPDITLYRIHCSPDCLTDENTPAYQRICELLGYLTRLYMKDAPMFRLEASGIALQVYALLLRHFSVKSTAEDIHTDQRSRQRIQSVLSYVEQHYAEPVTLDDVCGYLGLNKEYFCRFFKKNMGISFLPYLNEVRVTHIYHDLVQTDLPVSDLMEKHGFLNQKLFYRTFKEIFGCTPGQVRTGSGKPE